MKRNIGDRVRIKSLDWYNMHCDDAGNVDCGCEIFEKDMKSYLGKVFTIHRIVDNSKYEMEEAFDFFLFTDEMIEGLVEEENNDCKKCGLTRNSTRCLFMDNCPHNKQKNIMEEETKVGTALNPIELKSNANCLTREMIEEFTEEENEKKLSDESWRYKNIFDSSQYPQSFELPEGYIFKDENGNVINATKIVLEKQKKEYPKTYEECCKVLDWNHRDYDRVGYKSELLCKLQMLLICGDAYWKKAGEEMGLGEPWKNGRYEVVYGICRDEGNIVKQDDYWGDTLVFEYPIREMRDAFKENFDPDIEFCKELL